MPALTNPPNVILIVLDTFRHDSLDFSPTGTTPSLSAFAADSTVYENCTSTSSWTLPAHASIFTGLYPTTHGAQYLAYNEDILELYKDGNFKKMKSYHPLERKNRTMAEILRDNGYRTYGVVANFLFMSGYTGITQGFEIYDSRFNPPSRYSRSLMKDLIYFPAISSIISFLSEMTALAENSLQYGKKIYRRAESINKSAEAVLQKNSSAPFFLFINYMDTHNPYFPPMEYRNKFQDKVKKQWVKLLHEIPGYKELMREGTKLSKEKIEHIRASYKGEVMYLDKQVGRFLKYLKDSGMYNNSMIILTSDHGEQLGEHDLMEHACGLYNESIKVPLIIKYPGGKSGKRPGKRIISQNTQLVDILPTVLKSVGINIPRSLEGYPLENVESWGQKQRSIVSEQNEKPYFIHAFGKRFRGIRRSLITYPYKYVWDTVHEDKLFNLDTDPQENRNIINNKRNIADKMRKRLEEWLLDRKPVVRKRKSKSPGQDEVERLKSLGYL